MSKSPDPCAGVLPSPAESQVQEALGADPRRVAALLSLGVLTLSAAALSLWSRPLSPKPVVKQVLSPAQVSASSTALKARLSSAYGKLPLSFEVNAGQTDRSVKFISRGPGYSLFLTSDQAVLSLKRHAGPSSQSTQPHHPSELNIWPESSAPALLHMKLIGANPHARVRGSQELPGRSNYFLGNDPAKWRVNIPSYSKVKYEGVFPGVDLVYYGNQGQLEYDFVVAPGSDPKTISLEFSGAGFGPGHATQEDATPRIDASGDLILGRQGAEVRLRKPVVYQVVSEGSSVKTGNRKLLEGGYVLAADNRITFEVPSYDRTKPLVIDPILTYSTYLGGTGNDVAMDITLDAAGNAYVVGSTTSLVFPTTIGAYQSVLRDGLCANTVCGDAFVTKLASTGSSVVFSTYLGGSGQDYARSIAVDASGNSYVTGATNSPDFPTASAIQTTYGGGASDAFVTEIGAAGNTLLYSTYLGGSDTDQGMGIALDSAGEAHVVGSTMSANFAPASALGTCRGGGISDAFVSKLNSTGTAFVYSTCFGGSGSDQAYSVALNSSGYAYIAGSTSSTNFPTTTRAYQSTLRGAQNAFITVVNPTATSPFYYSSYFGGTGSDDARGIVLDSNNYAYITGTTTSADFPVSAGVFQPTYGGGGDAYVARLNLTASGKYCLVYSTYIGGSGNEVGLGVAVDIARNVYVTGITTSASDFPVLNAVQPVYGGGPSDSFVVELNYLATTRIYSTYLGGSGAEDSGLWGGIAVDRFGNTYVVGVTSSVNFPTVTGSAFQAANAGGSDAFVAKIDLFSPNVPGLRLLWPLPTLVQASILQQSYAEYNRAVGNAYHAGMDLMAPAGTPIGAAADGNVVMMQLNPPQGSICYDHGYGNVVIVQHTLPNGQTADTHYAHMLAIDPTLQAQCGAPDSSYRITCNPPIPVKAQQTLGQVGHTACGYSDTNIADTHLHFEFKNFPTIGAHGNDSGPYPYSYEPPESYGWYNPLRNLHPYTAFTTAIPVVVTASSPVSLLTGPGGAGTTAYRAITQVNPGDAFDVFGLSPATTTPPCSSGWYEVAKLDGTMPYDVLKPGQLPTGWLCADFVSPMVAPGPILSVSPPTLSFNATAGSGINPSPATVNVSNIGSGTLSFTAASDSTWLAVTPTSGTAPASLQVSATLGTLTAGTYTGHITITPSGGPGSPATVTVTFVVTSPSPVLSVSTTTLSFSATQGSATNPAPASLNVTNTGSGTLSFTAASDSAWLAVTPASGTAPASLQVSATVGTLLAGTYTGHITVTSAGAVGSPATVTVTFVVGPPPTLAISTATLSFAATQGSSTNPAPATVNVTNTGGGTLGFTAASDSAWLAVTPPSGTAPASLQVSATVGTLLAGTYTGHITVTSGGAVGSPATVTVTFVVAAPSPVLSVSPATISFTATVGSGANPAPAAVNVTNTGTGALSFTAAGDSAWLAVTPASGTAPASLQVSAALGTLLAGTYTGHISLTSAGAVGSPATVTVTFVVAPPPPPGGFFVRGNTKIQSAAQTTIAQGWPVGGQPQQGDLLVAYVWWNSSSVAITKLADNCGNAWVATPAQINTTDNTRAQLYYVAGSKSCGSSPYTTVTFAAAVSSRMILGDWSGMGVGAAYYDAGATAYQAATSIPLSTVTTTNANDLLIQVAVGNNATDTFTSGSGFTNRAAAGGMVLADKTVSTAQSYSTDLTSNVPDDHLSGIFAFRLTAASAFPLQSNYNALTATAISCGYPQSVKAGDLLAAIVRWPTDNTVTMALSDNLNGVWLPAGGQAFETAGPHSSQLFYLPNSLGGSVTVTATPSNGASQQLYIECIELTGMSVLPNPLDGTPAIAANSSAITTALKVGPVTTTNANDVLILGCATNAGNSFIPDTGFINVQQVNRLVIETQAVGSAGSYTQACRGGGAYYTGSLAAFRQAP